MGHSFNDNIKELVKITQLIAFGEELKKNRRWYLIVLFSLPILFSLFMILIVNASFLLNLAGLFVLSNIITIIFDRREEEIFDRIKDFCKRNNIDFPEKI